jgi:hypothetical protein
MSQTQIKINFEKPQELENLKREFLDVGVKRSEIECSTTPLKNGVGSRYCKEDRSDFYATRFALGGTAIGFVCSIIFLFVSNEGGFLNTILKFDLSASLLTSLIIGAVSGVIGFRFGSKRLISTVNFESGDGSKRNFWMTVRTKKQYLEELRRITAAKKTSGVEVLKVI